MDTIVDTFIDKLTNNLDKTNVPNEIDLVISGGAFNGSYAIGILMYIQKLEHLKCLSVRRISGASVGSMVGLAYLLNKLNLFNDLSIEMINLFKTKYNLYDMKNKLMKVLKIMDKNDYKKLNNKLFITYFNTNTKKQVIVKKYKNNEEVIECIFKSCYIPFFMDGNTSYKGNVDGGYPYILEKNNEIKIMYVNLFSFKHITGVLCLKNETNSYFRILKGILDVDVFFKIKKNTHFCSYVNNWNVNDYFFFRSNEYFLFIVLILLDIFNRVNSIIPIIIKENEYYKWLKRILFILYKDIVDKYIN